MTVKCILMKWTLYIYIHTIEDIYVGRNDPTCTVVANRSYTHVVHVEGGRKRREPEGGSY